MIDEVITLMFAVVLVSLGALLVSRRGEFLPLLLFRLFFFLQL